MDNSPILSIILPVYNGEAFVGRAIKSVVMQEFTAWELIIIDDGSTDHTGQICTDFSLKDNRIQYYHQKNRGLSAARNAGFRRASGKFIAYLDADDYVELNYYSELISSAENSGADFVIAGFFRDFIHEKGLQKQVKIEFADVFCSRPQLSKYNENLWFYNLYIHVWNKLYKRENLLKYHIYFDETVYFGEDVPYNILYLQYVEKIHFSCTIGYHYICHQQTHLTGNWNELLPKENSRIFDEIICFEKEFLNLDKHPLASGMYLRGCFLSVEKALKHGKKYRELKLIIKQMLNSPYTIKGLYALKDDSLSFEFWVYKTIIALHNPLALFLTVIVRKNIKSIMGR